MSRTTPRRSKHRQHPSGHGSRIVAASDYESDVVQYVDSRAVLPPPPHPPLTNTELNLSVLRRYLPSIRSLISIAANAVVYNFSPNSESWEKSGVEGTLFVCDQEPVLVAGHPVARQCVFVLNRRGLNNVVVELCHVSICQKDGDLIVFNVENNINIPGSDAEAGSNGRIIGLWLHADEENTREVNAQAIQDAWRKSRSLDGQDLAGLEAQGERETEEHDPYRTLTINELFGRESGLPR